MKKKKRRGIGQQEKPGQTVMALYSQISLNNPGIILYFQ